MKFYFDKNDGTLSICQVEEAIETKKADPLECVSYMTVGGYIRIELD